MAEREGEKGEQQLGSQGSGHMGFCYILDIVNYILDIWDYILDIGDYILNYIWGNIFVPACSC